MDIILVYVVILALIAIFTYIKDKNIVSPIVIFNSLWCFIFLCAVYNELVTTAKSTTFNTIFWGIVFFDAGCMIANRLKLKKIRLGNHVMNISDGVYVINKRIVYVLLLMCFVYYVLNFLMLFKSVEIYNFANIMELANTEDTLVKQYKVVNFIYTIILNPFSYILPFIVATDYWIGERNKTIFFGSIVTLAIRLFSSGNRLSFVFVFVFMVLVGLLLKRIDREGIRSYWYRKEKRRAKYLIALFVVVAILVFVYSTISRGYDVQSNVFINFAIPLRMFEIWSEKVSSNGDYGLGFASFQGLLYPLFYVLKNSIGFPIPRHILTVYDVTNRTVTEWVSGGTYLHNAYVSIFWYFFYDFRVVGIGVLSLLMGFFSQKSYITAIKKTNIKAVAIYCAYIRMIIGSYAGMTFSNVGFGVGLIFLLFIIYKKKKMV